MAKKHSKKQPRRQFDWQTYSKPPRLLSDTQETALVGGLLSPLLQLARTDPQTHLAIRARSANLYYRGASLVRVGGDGPFAAELDAPAGGAPTRVALETAEQVEALMKRLGTMRTRIDEERSASGRPERDYLQVIAEANAGADMFGGDYVVVDLEYTYGKRRYDLVALHRYEGVTGPGGFVHANLAFLDVRCPGQNLGGGDGLDAVGADLAEFAKALGGSHLQRAGTELAELAAQKVRLGLLPPELEVRTLGESLPELLAVFADFDVANREFDAPIVALHEKMASRHYPPGLLRFAHLPAVGARDDASLVLGESAAMTYRQFKEYRTRGRA